MSGPLVIPVRFLWLVRPFTHQHALHPLSLTACQEIVMVRFFSQCMRQKEMWNDKPGSLLNDSLSDCCQNDLLSCHVLPVFAGQGNYWAV